MALDWEDKKILDRALRRVARFVRWMVPRLDAARCEYIAQDAITFYWEKSRTERFVVEDERDLRKLACDKAYSLARKEMVRGRNHLSFDDPDEERTFDKWAYARCNRANQIELLYFDEIRRGIGLLPIKHRAVMGLLCEGHNAIDIAVQLRLPIWLCMARIDEARRMLFWHGLVEVGIVGTVPS